MTAINPQHRSMLGRTRRPRNMASVRLPEEVRVCVERTALDIFADMTNAGWSFQAALLAVYLSGLEHGRQA